MVNINDFSACNIMVDESWNFGNATEWLMHSIHSYPAKFPAFIASKAFEYAESEGICVKKVADVFCGCGTVALESKLHGKDFWGCDINPVAALIANVKSASYKIDTLQKYYDIIYKDMMAYNAPDFLYEQANERLQYWFERENYLALYEIKHAIECSVPKGKYKNFFLCVFSSILKSASKWLTKSIKPQIDPYKKRVDVKDIFSSQFQKFLCAVKEIDDIAHNSEVHIRCNNFLKIKKLPVVDLILTSPPYVTSYEYADLHQLSSLWLDFVQDYRALRKGSIGSSYNHTLPLSDVEKLNETARNIILQLRQTDVPASKIHSITRYFLDLQQTAEKCSRMLHPGGMAFFVIGDTEYKGVPVQNSKHLIQSLLETGFSHIKIGKRKISKKILTPYRDQFGRFSSNDTAKKVYHEEWIISGRM